MIVDVSMDASCWRHRVANQVLTGLIRRRAELDGEGIRLRKRLEQITLDLARLDSAIGVFDAELDTDAIRPVRMRAPNVVTMGHWSRRALDVLRRAGEPLSAKEITSRVMILTGMDLGNAAARRLATKRVRHALAGQRDQGLVTVTSQPGARVAWELT